MALTSEKYVHYYKETLKIIDICAGKCAMNKYLQLSGGILHDTYLQ